MIIGAQKAGTTALAHMLKQHPFVLGPTEKVDRSGEIHYFDDNFEKGEKWYKKHFFKKPSSEYVNGDRSPYYLFHPLVARRVHENYPKVKLIIVLRNPVDRAYSHYWFNIALGQEPLSFEEALFAEPSRLEGEEARFKKDPLYKSNKHRFFSYLARSRYVEQIKHWLKFFPKEQILFIEAAELRKRPRETLHKVFSFLGLPKFDVVVSDPEKNMHYPPMDNGLRKSLEEYFKPYNAELEELLECHFNW